jgi:hypothetical protein
MQLTPEQCEAVQAVANGLISKGYSKEEAIRIACLSAGRVLQNKAAGMGATTEPPNLVLDSKDGPNGIIAEVRANVSPWLWILSVVSFGMALVNAKRISKMFGDWKRRRKPA